jgi:hypothetical protein
MMCFQWNTDLVRFLRKISKSYFHSAYQCLRHEFPEGVRALLVDRDNSPKWNPATIEEIPDSLMQTFFEEKPNAWHPTKPWQ